MFKSKSILILSHTDLKLFALMLQSGISPVDALRDISLSLKRYQISMVNILIEELYAGRKFSEILTKTSLGKSKLYIHMLESAEVSGNIPEILEKISEHMTESQQRKSQIITVLIYPVIVLGMAVILILGLLIFIIPNIMPIVQMNSQNLPLVTKLLIFLSESLRQHGLAIGGIFIGLAAAFVALLQIKQVRKYIEKVSFKIPFLDSFIEAYISSGYTLALYQYTSMTPDLPLTFSRLSQGSSSLLYKKEFADIERKISEGETLSQAFEKSKVIHSSWLLFARVAEQTSSYSIMFKNLYEYYRQIFDHKSKLLIKFAEPALMIMIGGVVGILAYGILSPLYSLMNGLK